MKVSLRQEEGCSVLDVDGNIDDHNFAVLKAGLTKLLQNGKNRIILNIQGANEVPGDVIRELAILDVFARELSGKIVIASENPDIKSKINTFAKPAVVSLVPSVGAAVKLLNGAEPVQEEEGAENLAEVVAQLEARNKQVVALEAQLKLADTSELQKIRAENAVLKDKLMLLEKQMGELAIKRTDPADEQGFEEKIAALEESLKRLSTEKVEGAKK